MSDTTDRLRQIVEQSNEVRAQDFSEHEDGRLRDWYPMYDKAGAFVGDLTGFVVADPGLVAAMLDVIDAAQQIADCPDWPDGCVVGPRKMNALDDALARFREVAGE